MSLPPEASILQRTPFGGVSGTGTSSHTYAIAKKGLVGHCIQQDYRRDAHLDARADSVDELTGSGRPLCFRQACIVSGGFEAIRNKGMQRYQTKR